MRYAYQNQQVVWYTMCDLLQGSKYLIIDRYISSEVIRPFCGGLGLLVLVFVGYSATIQLNLAAQGQMGLFSAFKLILLNTLITLEILMPSALFFSVLPPSAACTAIQK